MAKARAKSRTQASGKGISVVMLYVLAVVCFIASKMFVKIDFANYGFAIAGFALFGLAFYRYIKSRKKR